MKGTGRERENIGKTCWCSMTKIVWKPQYYGIYLQNGENAPSFLGHMISNNTAEPELVLSQGLISWLLYKNHLAISKDFEVFPSRS